MEGRETPGRQASAEGQEPQRRRTGAGRPRVILYLDTWALVKAYVAEAHSSAVANAMAKATAVASRVIAFVEARAAFARLGREGALTAEEAEVVKGEFVADWPRYLRVGPVEAVIERAADLCEAFGLRAYDGVHLAAAEFLQRGSRKPVAFGCFDRKLNQAARVLGLLLLESR